MSISVVQVVYGNSTKPERRRSLDATMQKECLLPLWITFTFSFLSKQSIFLFALAYTRFTFSNDCSSIWKMIIIMWWTWGLYLLSYFYLRKRNFLLLTCYIWELKRKRILLLSCSSTLLECDVRSKGDNEKRYQEAWKWNLLCNIVLVTDGHLSTIIVHGCQWTHRQALRVLFLFLI